MPDVDFEFGEAAGASSDAPERSASRHPAVIVILVGLVVAAVVVIVANRGGPKPAAKPVAGTSSPAPPSAAQAALAGFVLLAESADKLPNDYLSDRELVCPAGNSAAALAAATSVLQANLPGYLITDSATTRGAKGTLCGLRIKARDALGATVIITILSPTDASNAAFVISHGNDRSTVVDVGVIDQGWSVQVGWLGQTGAAMGVAALQAAAADPRLLW